ncbi:uncharacterized protein TNCT_145461 [Trichonephila clavata]|uniref:Secreted protein n=1 Tax=Trichonephila clavata TaxID=2740835 RepID=A0A8X6LDU8_TRICU|nr:uncharacterized protein TNCT_145461 [Trichonephila clavata]
MNGLHLLALLAGIYLMIFVVEPVAVPNRLLSQHYFGVPWIPERSTYPLQYNPTLEVISASAQTHTDVIDLKRKDFETSYEKRNSNTSHYHMDTISPSYPFLLSNYSEKPLSLQAAHTKHKVAQTRGNKTSTYHWHRWSSKPILNQRSRVIGYNGTVRNLQHSRNDQISRSSPEMKTTGSVKSIDISEVLH